MVPGGKWWRIREALDVVRGDAAIGTAINRARDEIVLIVTTQEQLLVICQVEVETGDVSVQLRRRTRIEAKAAGVETITDCGVVRWIALRRSRQETECSRVDARSFTVERRVCGVNFSRRQTVDTRWGSGRTARIAETTFSAIAHDALAQRGQRHFAHD